MALLDSLVTVLQHQLSISIKSEDCSSLQLVISLIREHLNSSHDVTHLDEALKPNIIRLLSSDWSDSNSRYKLLRCCLPICSNDLVETITECLSAETTSASVRLDFYAMILTHCPAGQTTSQLKVKFLHEILEQLADIVESDDISMGKRAGRLLHLVWSVVDDEALSRIDGVLCGVDEKGVRSSCTYLILTCICDLLLKENRFMKSFWHLLVEVSLDFS